MYKTVLSLLFIWLQVMPVAAAPDGERLYNEHCLACHKQKGKGGIGLPISTIKLSYVSDEYLRKTIRLGRPGRIMPAFNDLSDAQVDALVRYMRNWSGHPGPVYSHRRISGDIKNGWKRYKAKCAKCHADDGTGEGKGTGVTFSRKRRFLIMPAAINNRGFLASAPDELIKAIILSERDDSKMPSMAGILSDQEINDVVAFVRNFEKQQKPQTTTDDEKVLSYVIESPNDFETTLDNIRQALTGSNFRTFPDRFLEQGLVDEFSHNTRQVTIRFCNFNKLYDLLKIEPRFGTVLPCRITVMERKDGTVVLVAPNMKEIASWFNNDELTDHAIEMDENIRNVMEEATF